MVCRKAELSDLDKIMSVIADARRFLLEQNVDQWQDGFPDRDVIREDILHHETFVFQNGGDVSAYVSLSLEPEESYKNIDHGGWLTEGGNYATVHRTAIAKDCRGQGLSARLFSVCEKTARERNMQSIRVDTHPDHLRMRHIIEKNGYTLCGRIFLTRGGAERFAYEKLLDCLF